MPDPTTIPELFEQITDSRLENYRIRLKDEYSSPLGMYIKHEGGVRCSQCGLTTHEGYQYEGIGECCFRCGVVLTMRGFIERIAHSDASIKVLRDALEAIRDEGCSCDTSLEFYTPCASCKGRAALEATKCL